ncbi:ferredoxin [Nocardia harenae]|uniref:ferredoxin n=1 Tax=Nocardia harenae TaxID=358707 RepID=UPI000835D115|nr:ferredoxin [Nocardia harenae]
MHVSVDQTRCQGHAMCLAIAPELFDFDDREGRAFVADGGHADTETMRRAAANCPEGAIGTER